MANETAQYGVFNNNSKLTEAKVLSIMREIKEGKSNVLLGRKYGVTPMTIAHIKKGRTWKHLTNSEWSRKPQRS